MKLIAQGHMHGEHSEDQTIEISDVYCSREKYPTQLSSI